MTQEQCHATSESGKPSLKVFSPLRESEMRVTPRETHPEQEAVYLRLQSAILNLQPRDLSPRLGRNSPSEEVEFTLTESNFTGRSALPRTRTAVFPCDSLYG